MNRPNVRPQLEELGARFLPSASPLIAHLHGLGGNEVSSSFLRFTHTEKSLEIN
jgi:hypothetical protein